MITFWIDSLPPAGVNVVGSAKSGAEYNAAAEQMRGEVSAALPPPPEAPYAGAAVTVTLFVGEAPAIVVCEVCQQVQIHGDSDHPFTAWKRYRPEGAWWAKDALEPLLYALKDAGFIESVKAVVDFRVRIDRNWQSEGEGMWVEVEGS